MRSLAVLPIALLVLAALPAHAAWHAANPAAAEAVKNPRIAAVLDATARMDKAILAHDVSAFGDTFTRTLSSTTLSTRLRERPTQ